MPKYDLPTLTLTLTLALASIDWSMSPPDILLPSNDPNYGFVRP